MMAETAEIYRHERLPDLTALRAADPDAQARAIAEYICQELDRFLDGPPPHGLSTSRPLRAQGVGSITALKLRRTIEIGLGIDVEVSELLRDDTVEEVAVLLAARLDSERAPRDRFAGTDVRRP